MLSNLLSAGSTLVALLITVARDRDSDSEDCWSCYFFRPPIFRHPCADFRETVPYDAACSEIVDLL